MSVSKKIEITLNPNPKNDFDDASASQLEDIQAKKTTLGTIDKLVSYAVLGKSSITITKKLTKAKRYRLDERLFVLGDFNFNLLQLQNRNFFKTIFSKSLGLQLLNPDLQATRKSNSLIDWCLK